jgi:C4-dicarboxylate-specific signal transduction histidine kinase
MDASGAVEETRRVVTIGGHRAPRDGTSEVVVSVRDGGVGVTAEQVAELFEPFYTTKAQGMGFWISL